MVHNRRVDGIGSNMMVHNRRVDGIGSNLMGKEGDIIVPLNG